MKPMTVNGQSWTMRQRRDLPMMTPPMMKLLLILREAHNADSPFIHLDGVHKRTMTALLDRDWIFASPGVDGTRYKITGRGLKALQVYEPVERRRDDICPDCNERPKHVTKSGRKEGYCIECLRKSDRRKYHLGIDKNPNTLCPRCKKRPRHRQPGGKVITYCEHCDRVRKRAAKRKKQREQKKLLRAGGFIKCRIAGCDACVHFTEKSVYDQCEMHWRAFMTAYNDKRRPASKAAKSRRVKTAGGTR